MNKELQTKCHKLAVKFERDHGSTEILKIAFGSLNKLLVKKGIINEDELIQSTIDEIKIYEETR